MLYIVQVIESMKLKKIEIVSEEFCEKFNVNSEFAKICLNALYKETSFKKEWFKIHSCNSE